MQALDLAERAGKVQPGGARKQLGLSWTGWMSEAVSRVLCG